MKKAILIIIGLLLLYGLVKISNPYYVPDKVNEQIIQEEGL